MTSSDPTPASTPARARWLLIVLVLTWAITWPAIKIGVTSFPPIWYGCFRYVIATLCLFLVIGWRGHGTMVLPSQSDWRLVAVSGVLQMAVFSALAGSALTRLPAGRAAVLAYSTPIWVIPLAAWWLRERITRQAKFGVGAGLVGMLIIAAPTWQADGRSHLVGYAMLMGAAAAWALSIVFVRAHRFEATPIALAPWQMLIAAVLLGLLAVIAEGPPPTLRLPAIASLAYVGPFATAFAYWAMVELGRHFPASTISMALLGTPSVGLLLSVFALGEPVNPSLAVGVGLVGVGILLATGRRTSRQAVAG